jgi:hypothetical protein
MIASPQRHRSVVRKDHGAGARAKEATMAYPTINIGNKKIILLSGFERAYGRDKTLAVTAEDRLEKATKRHHDAVAFGYVSGMWIAAA